MSLQIIVTKLYNLAKGLPEKKAASQHLENGLRVEIWTEGDEVYLQLSRPNTYPSSNEWKIVIGRWPVPATGEYMKRIIANRYCLVGAVKPIEALFPLPHSTESEPYA